MRKKKRTEEKCFLELFDDVMLDLDAKGELNDIKNKEDNTIKFKDGMDKLVEKGYFVRVSSSELRKLIAVVVEGKDA